MIVGRDSHFLYLMQRYVRTSAHPIVSANLGEDILALAKSKQPAVIILEVEQPETIGWQTLQTLKADPQVGRTPIIVCSWLDDQVRGLAEGANIYLRLPILYADFCIALAAVLGSTADAEPAVPSAAPTNITTTEKDEKDH